SYLEQFFRIVDPKLTEVRWQSEWYGSFGLDEVLRLTSRFTVAQMLAREDFGNRMEAGSPIAVTELLYPLLQAYDSVVVEADVEFGGIDQKFNCLLGRELQRMEGQPPQDVFLVPLLVGTDGQRKMSKSYGNYIGIAEPPEEQYGKVMSLPDELILPYFEMVTDVPEPELREIAQGLEARKNPRDHKMRLAREIVTQFHGAQAAQAAEEEFRRVFQERQRPSEVPTFPFCGEATLVAILADSGLAPSRSEARRLIAAGSVDILDNVQIQDKGGPAPPDDQWRTVRAPGFRPKPGDVIRVGKRRFLRLVSSPSED
ncbi:MAG: tyrosine--tRNA ligase, partial [Chloroflexi bacterium]|nr:tyrosine--tRNA ligase [Chloroflexota bacterium]